MKNLILSLTILFISLTSFSQLFKNDKVYSFEMKEYNKYYSNGFLDSPELKNKVNPEKCTTNRKYVVDLENKKLTFYENDKFVDELIISNISEENGITELVVESYLDPNNKYYTKTNFLIYFTISKNKLKNISIFYYNPWYDNTTLKVLK
jgi:hypothetical protein